MKKHGFTREKATNVAKQEFDSLTEIMQNTKKLDLAGQLKQAAISFSPEQLR